MARGDTLNNERTFSDRDDEGEEVGGFTGGIPYDEDEDEDGGWAINKDHSDSLWDSTEDADADDEDAETPEVVDAGEGEEEEADLFGGSLNTPRRRGRRPAEKPLAAGGSAAPMSATLGSDDEAAKDGSIKPAGSAPKAANHPSPAKSKNSPTAAAKTPAPPARRAAAKETAAKSAKPAKTAKSAKAAKADRPKKGAKVVNAKKTKKAKSPALKKPVKKASIIKKASPKARSKK